MSETSEPEKTSPELPSADTPATPVAPAPEEKPSTSGPLRQFMGLFVVPLLVVLVCVGVFIGFGWLAYEEHTAGDYLDDLRSPWPPRRRQAAYELSRVLTVDRQALAEDPTASAELRSLYRESKDDKVRQYLAVVMGYTGDREALPLLIETVRTSPDSQSRIYALWALGGIGDPAALGVLEESLGDADPGLRKTAAFALGEMGDEAAVPALTASLDDGITDVRWNAALALARLGSDAGAPILRQMLDRKLLAQVPEITTEQQEEAMVGAIAALAAVERDGARPLLLQLEKEDPSLKVRQAAIEARKILDRPEAGVPAPVP